MELVKKGGFAYHTQPETAYLFAAKHFDNRQICEMTEVHLARPHLVSMFVSKNNTFIEMLRVG